MPSIDLSKALDCLDSVVSILEPVRDERGAISDFKYLYSNSAIETIHSVSSGQVQQKTFLKVCRVSRDLFTRIINVLERNEPFSEDIFSIERGQWLRISFKKYNDNLFLQEQDITQEKQSEEELRTNEKLFSTLFNNSGVGIVLMNYEGKVIKANAKMCEMFGFEKDEAIGLDRGEVYPPNRTENGWELYIKLINKEINFYEIEKQYKRKDGSIFWALLTVSLFDNNEQNPLAIAVIQDIDLRKQAEESVAKLNKDLIELNDYKDKVVSVIAHDLSSPFSTCKGLLDNIIELPDTTPRETVLFLVQLLHKKFTQINELLAELVLWTRNQLNKMSFQPKEIDVEKELQKVVSICTEQANEKQIHIVFNSTKQLTAIADTNMFDAIARNLLNNAIKFSPEGAEVLIKAENLGGETLISITDFGAGITEEIIKNIETGRNQCVSYGTKGEKGLGLGLSLSKEFIEKNGGKLKIETKVNSGTTVSFTLPA